MSKCKLLFTTRLLGGRLPNAASYIVAIITLLTILYFVFCQISGPSYGGIDSLYNLGVAKRSAMPQSKYFLETSMVTLIYENTAIPSPEPSRRGISIILLKYWQNIKGDWDPNLRFPHLFWVLAWLIVGMLHLKQTQAGIDTRQEKIQARSGSFILWKQVLFATLLTTSAWSVCMLREQYLDDIPGAFFILCASFILYPNPWNIHRAFFGGIITALGFAQKDFLFIWLPITITTYFVYYFFCGRKQSHKTLLSTIVLFCLGYAIPFLIKATWNIHDNGGVFTNPVQHFIRLLFHADHSEHLKLFWPYFLYNDSSYTSALALSGGMYAMLANLVTKALPLCVLGFISLSGVWIWCIPAMTDYLIRCKNRSLQMTWTHCIFWVCLAAYYLFCFCGFAEGTQLHYWPAPIAFAYIIGINSFESLFFAFRKKALLAIILLLFLGGALCLHASSLPNRFLDNMPESLYVNEEGLAEIYNIASTEHSRIMMPSYSAIHYYVKYPDQEILMMWNQLADIDFELGKKLLDIYDIGFVLVDKQFTFANADILQDRLPKWSYIPENGFDINDDRWILYRRNVQKQ
ncbi:MAG: hypothetical protein H3C30_07715 [Candidatus Hydrogenedentes bacterium]|nr:hypothetical protein [Candidatus Hydrogenedentota bacterium]